MIHLLLAVVLPLAMAGQDEANAFQRDPAKRKTIQTLIHSTRWQEREKGFRLAKSFGCAETEAVGATLKLLRIEKSLIENQVAKGASPAEAWGGYYDELLGFAFSCFKLSPRSDWFQTLALGGYGPDSRYARELTKYVNGNLPWLLQAAQTQESQYTRANLYPLLVRAVADHPAWPAKDRSAVLSAVERALMDPEPYVWMSTTLALETSDLKEAHGLLVKAKAELARRPNVAPILLKNIDRAIEKTANPAIR